MKPVEGRRRVILENLQPSVDGGRYAAKRVVGDVIVVTATIFGDGHDQIAARLLYRHSRERKWRVTSFRPLGNDVWQAEFSADKLGEYRFTAEAWVDHVLTWKHDLVKRLEAQPLPLEAPDARELNAGTEPQDIPLAFRTGANLLEKMATRAEGEDAAMVTECVKSLRWLADQQLPHYDNPISEDLVGLAKRYPDTSFSTKHETEMRIWVDRRRAQFSSWYELFPRSASPDASRHGTFADVEALLPEIAAMGFDILYLPPIHPIGKAFRKGKNNSVTAAADDLGSPWAIGSEEGGHKSIHPQLGTLDDFQKLIKSADEQGVEMALDIAFQCSPDHPWVKEHPEWFVQRADGTIQYAENPPKKYQDIYPLNFESTDWRGLWEELYSVFDYWVRHGVRIFRVDNPHTKAIPFWEWCIEEVHKKNPDVIFLAEAFTRPHVMYGLAKLGYTQSYTYFTWRNTKAELTEYLTEITRPPVSDFFRPNFWPNTPDILHESLQKGGLPAFKQRLILAATLSANYGIYGPVFELGENIPAKTKSEEYLHSEKYQQRTWDRSAPHSLSGLVTTINRIRRENHALQSNISLQFHAIDNNNLIAYSKSTPGHHNVILTVVNLDPAGDQTGWLNLNLPALGLRPENYQVMDLLTGEIYNWHGAHNYIALGPDRPAHILRIVR